MFQIDIVAVTDLPDGVKIQAAADLIVHVKKMKGMKVELIIHTEYSQEHIYFKHSSWLINGH